jgi:hypothetical protein
MLRLIVFFISTEYTLDIIASVSRYESCKLWIDSVRSDSTKKSYGLHVLLFCRFYNTNPDELVKIKPNKLKDMVIDYVIKLRKKSKNAAGKPKKGEMSVNSVKQYVAGIKSFLDEHEILKWKCTDEFISR